jgi:HSP20 family protein
MFGDDKGGPDAFAPLMDVTETDREYVVKMDVPGIPKENLSINLEDHQLVVRGERSEEKKEENENRIVVERRYGSLFRSLGLPKAASEEEVDAEVKDGVLTIRIKKVEEAKPRRIEIK